LQRGAQLVVLAQAHLGFAKGPVFLAQQAQHRQQLRLGKLMFAEARALGRQNLRGYLQRHASKRQEPDLGHGPSCPIRKHRKPLLVDSSERELCRGCQQATGGVGVFFPFWNSPGGAGDIPTLNINPYFHPPSQESPFQA
jgi:hypothetical protein